MAGRADLIEDLSPKKRAQFDEGFRQSDLV